jgi:AMP-binding enzyme
VTALSLASALAEPGRRRPDVTALVEGPARLTYGELWRDALAVAAALDGLSETSPTATVNQRVFGTRPGTVGHPVWDVEVEIADAAVPDRIELLPPGETGETVICGHNVFAGYLNRPEATAEVMTDGWFRTGDVGAVGADGFVTIVDRRKDLITRAASTSTRGRSRRCSPAIPTSARSRSSACPTPSAARRSAPSSSPGRATRSTSMPCSRGASSTSPGTSIRGWRTRCPNCPWAPRRRCSSGNCAGGSRRGREGPRGPSDSHGRPLLATI